MGSMIQSVAAAWLMTGLTQSHLLIALVAASTTIPVMLLGIFAGAIADNFDRRRVMLAAQTGMLIVSAALTLTTYMDAITPLTLLFFTLAVGCGTALNGPAWQASVRLQVGPRDLPQAIALNTIAFNLARSVGPAPGGMLGRASCRESVGQYVYISVVAVSVKKKNITQSNLQTYIRTITT